MMEKNNDSSMKDYKTNEVFYFSERKSVVCIFVSTSEFVSISFILLRP